MSFTPRDSVDALRLMRKHEDVLIHADDDAEVKESIAGTVALFIARKREGRIGADVDFLDWYENGDASDLADEEAGPDPTE